MFGAPGRSSSEAINLFLNQVVLNQGLPFAVPVPDEATRRAIAETRASEDWAAEIGRL